MKKPGSAADPLWYEGDGSNLSPQIESALEPYLDEAHARVVAVLPLKYQPPAEGSRGDQNGRPGEPETIGVLVVERFEADVSDAGWKHRIEAVNRHSALAVHNALAHQGLPFYSALKVLEKAGLIARGREAQWRPCKLDAEPLKEVADWVGEYRKFWEERFDRLDAYLRELQQEEKENDNDSDS